MGLVGGKGVVTGIFFALLLDGKLGTVLVYSNVHASVTEWTCRATSDVSHVN